MRIAILAYDGCVASGVNGFADVFGVANYGGRDLFSVDVVGSDKNVRPFFGPQVGIDVTVAHSARTRWEVVYVPPAVGLGVPPRALVDWVRTAHASGAIACGACAGVFFLAGAGILDNRVATTHWGLADHFQRAFPQVKLSPERMLVDGGDYVCAGGLTAYFDLALHLVSRFAGPQLAAECARMLLLDPGRASQTPYASLVGPSAHADESVTRAQQWLEEHHTGRVRMRELALAVHLGERTLLRRFKRATGRTPTAYLQAVRVEHAKRLLETTDAGVDEIVVQVGYADCPAFFRLFKSLTGLTPGEYRARFSCYGAAPTS